MKCKKKEIGQAAAVKAGQGKGFLYFAMVCCALLLCLFFFVVLARCFGQFVLVDMLGVPKEHPVLELLLKEREKSTMETEPVASDKRGITAGIETVSLQVRKLTDDFERLVEDYTIARDTVVFLVNRVENRMGFQLGTMDGESILSLDGGYLLEAQSPESDAAMREHVQPVIDLKKKLDAYGIPFVYAKNLQRVCTETDWIHGTLDFTVENAQKEREYLRSEGVDVLHLEAELHEDGIDHHSMFYLTDHHWTAAAGLWAAGKFAEYGAEQYGLDFAEELLAPELYRTETTEDIFLGSYGRRVTLAKTELEDFYLMYPTFDVDVGFWVLHEKNEGRGDFSVFYAKKFMDPYLTTKNLFYRSEPYSSLCYMTYFHGDVGISGVTNYNNPNGPRILLIGDSFDNAVAPFLSLAASNVIVVDPRKITTVEFEEEVLTRPFDLAICMITANVDRIVYPGASPAA